MKLKSLWLSRRAQTGFPKLFFNDPFFVQVVHRPSDLGLLQTKHLVIEQYLKSVELVRQWPVQ